MVDSQTKNKVEFLDSKDRIDFLVIQFTGDITSNILAEEDAEGHSIPAKLDFLLHHQSARKIFIFDFLAAGSIDSSTIGLAATVAKQKKKVRLVLKKGSLAHEAFQMVGLLGILPWHQTMDAALADKT